MTDLCLKNEAYTVCSALVPSRGLSRIFTYRTRHTHCVERLFLGVLMTDFCFKNEAYTVCIALVLPRGLCRIFTYRNRHTQCVARLFLRVAHVKSLVIERGIHSIGSLLLRVV